MSSRLARHKFILARHLAALRPRELETPDDSIRHTLRSLARRWQQLDAEANELSRMIEDLVMRTAPHLEEPFGIGVDTAAEIRIVAGDNPERIKSEAPFAKLAEISPVPAGSGMTSGKHRINHNGHRHLTRRSTAQSSSACDSMNQPLPTSPAAPPHRRRKIQTRHHPLLETLRNPRGLSPDQNEPQNREIAAWQLLGA